MRHMRGKIAAWLMTMAGILFLMAGVNVVPVQAATVEESNVTENGGAIRYESQCGVGPAYENEYSVEDIQSLLEEAEDSDITALGGTAVEAHSYEEAVSRMKALMKARETSFSLGITFTTDYMIFQQIMTDVFADDGMAPATEGDYILANFLGYSWNCSISSNQIYYDVQMTYCSTAEQEAQVDAAIPGVLASLALDGKSEYQKIKAIHDYVVEHVDYVNDGTYTCHSTYGALVEGQAVCQGYASLFGRLCKEAGIPVKYITGYAGAAHAWNIVKKGDYWYNVDTTWDDPVGGSLRYTYFLKANVDFMDHTRDDQYTTVEFYEKFPMAEFSYDDNITSMEKDNLSVTFQGIDGEILSSESEGKPKLLIFFNTNCGNSYSTIRDFAQSDWIATGGVDVYAIDCEKHTKEEVAQFRDTYCPNSPIKMAYAEDYSASRAMWAYIDLTNLEGRILYPVIVMIDVDNKVQFCTSGYLSAQKVKVSYLPALTKFPFSDVTYHPGNWKYDAVYYVYKNGIMNGISGTTRFDPDSQLNRAMFATVLYRMAGSPEVTYTDRFTDVVDGKYYSSAVLWAYSKGIVNGFSDGSYGVDTNITREQIAKMLCEYGKKQGYDMSAAASLEDFTDDEQVSGWATEYMQWAVASGMISGKPNGDGSFRLDPKGEATRAECAKMLSMFMQKYVDESNK